MRLNGGGNLLAVTALVPGARERPAPGQRRNDRCALRFHSVRPASQTDEGSNKTLGRSRGRVLSAIPGCGRRDWRTAAPGTKRFLPRRLRLDGHVGQHRRLKERLAQRMAVTTGQHPTGPVGSALELDRPAGLRRTVAPIREPGHPPAPQGRAAHRPGSRPWPTSCATPATGAGPW